MTRQGEIAPGNEPYQYDPVSKKCTIRGAADLPQEIFEIADDIEILDASFGQMSALPDNFGDLKNLRIAFLSNNDFSSLPEVLSTCPSLEMAGFKSCKIEALNPTALPSTLRGLILTDNRIGEVPDSIDRLYALQKLMLTGNVITDLPQNMLALKNLQLLRISMNQLDKSPDFVFDLPQLAWYSDSGNSFNNDLAPTEEIKSFSWHDLAVEGILGQSSKNIVYAGKLNGADVAIKMFGDGVTTDGDPTDDMNLSLAAGNHPHVIGGLGKVVESPDGRRGFVMPRIPDDYQSLGLPPDFVTLTRDVFPEDTSFSDEYILKVASDVASAMSHLSDMGIMHGDVYAHNILTNNDGESYIGDFGAASQYSRGTAPGIMREKVDVRGFGYLLDDLLARSADSSNARLFKLKDACLNEDPEQRPTFREIQSFLS